MSRRYSAEYLDQITGIAEKWRRRCEGQPRGGILVGHAELRVILAMSDTVTASSFGVITWRADGREFTAEPVQDELAE